MPGTTLEQAAILMKLCESQRESRGGNYAASADRRIELHPRYYLAIEGEARRSGTSTSGAVEGIIAWWLAGKVSEADKGASEGRAARI